MIKKWFAFFLKFLVSGGLIWLLLGSVDLDAAWERISDARPGPLIAVVAAYTFQILIIVWRWQAILVAMNIDLPFRKIFTFTYIGMFFNQALPSAVGGDAVRIYKVYKSGTLLSRAINSVMLDRVATVLALVLLALFAVPFFLDKVGDAEARWILPGVILLALGGFAGVVLLMVLDKMPSRISHYRLVRGMAALAADTRSVFLSPRHALTVMVVSLIGHANITFGAYLIGLSLDLGIDWVDYMVLMPPVMLLVTLPISIGGWGVREGAMVAAFALIGVPAEGILVLSILFGLVAILIALPGGVVWLLSGERKISLDQART